MAIKKFVVVQFQDENIQIIPTNFDREPGFQMKVDGRSAVCLTMLNSEVEKSSFIREWNKVISKANRLNRKIAEAAFWSKLIKENSEIKGLLVDLAYFKSIGIN